MKSQLKYGAAAELWCQDDPDLETQKALRRAIMQEDEAELERAMAEPLSFGTAGLRACYGAGPARINVAQILRVSYALSEFLAEMPGAERQILIGYDGRKESAALARAAAEVHRAWGRSVLLFEQAGPTPWVAFGVRFLGAQAGIVLTPSHNPRGDAGYKLYDSSGIQIVTPWDTEISRRFAAAPPARSIVRVTQGIAAPPEQLLPAYRAHVLSLARVDASDRSDGPTAPGGARVGYTALHGVGAQESFRVAAALGIELVPVASQLEPDGSFPTVEFPNPEEPGTLDELGSLLRGAHIDLGVAHDPDADRLCVVAPRLASSPGDPDVTFTDPSPLSGDLLGLVLADLVLDASGKAEPTEEERPLLVSSIVSSPAVAALARARGARHETTLTGFKFLCRPALASPGFVFAYEEALGYLVDPERKGAVFDKDGISAMAFLLGALRAKGGLAESLGQTLARRIDQLARELGIYVSASSSLRFSEGISRAKAISGQFRADPQGSLQVLDRHGIEISHFTDLLLGAESRPSYLGRQDLLILELSSGDRLCVRPSGTEPKLKFYLHLRGSLAPDEPYAVAENALTERAREMLRRVEAAFSALGS